MKRLVRVVFVLSVSAYAAFAPARAFAQTDEIQVYDGGLAPKGIFNLTIHNNFIGKGNTTPPYAGAVVADKSFNGVAEWALGVTNWFEAGLYLPLYSHDPNLGWGVNGAKLRALFAVPHADDRTFFYGANFEFSYNAKRWDSSRFGSEIRPIIGWHLGKADVIVNPIVDTAYDGWGNMTFVPAVRFAYSVTKSMQLAAETYSDFGPFNNFSKGSDQSQQLYGVVDYAGKGIEFEAGAGFGLTSASDDFTFKTILSFDLNKTPMKWLR